jgi:hypothetical protein
VLLSLGDGIADIGLFDEFEGDDDGVYCREIIPHASLRRCAVVKLYFLPVSLFCGLGAPRRGILMTGGSVGLRRREAHTATAALARARPCAALQAATALRVSWRAWGVLVVMLAWRRRKIAGIAISTAFVFGEAEFNHRRLDPPFKRLASRGHGMILR